MAGRIFCSPIMTVIMTITRGAISAVLIHFGMLRVLLLCMMVVVMMVIASYGVRCIGAKNCYSGRILPASRVVGVAA